jgi:hypothetical protein
LENIRLAIDRILERVRESGLASRWPLRGRDTGPYQALDDVEPLEGTVRDVFSPVAAPRGFRETLRHNLDLAAEHKLSGAVVEYPKPIRQIILITVSLGVVVATITTFVLFREARRDPESPSS